MYILGMYLDKTVIQTDICTPLFISALFTMAKTWKQTIYLSTDEGTKMYVMEYYSAIKNEGMPYAATWMDLELIILGKVSLN